MFYLFFTLIMAVVYYHMSMRIEINSDMASGLLEAKDMVNGNILLNGWSLSTVPFYFTELIWYAIGIAVFGFSHKLSYAFSAIYLAILCVTMVSASENKKLGAALSFFFLGSPVVFLSQNLLTPVVHVGTYILSLGVFILIKRTVSAGCKKSILAAYIIMSILYFSDAMSMYLVFIPLIVTSGTYLLGMKIEKRWLHITAVSIASYLTSILIWKLFTRYGFTVPGLQETKFASTTAIWKNISDFFEGTFRLYSAYFFGLSPKAPGTAQVCLSFLALLIFFGLLVTRLVSFCKFRGQDLYLLTATFIMPVAFIVSDISVGLGSIRYIIPFFVFGAVFASSNDTFNRFNARTFLALLMVFLVSGALHIRETLQASTATDKYAQINKALVAAGATNGFAAYWDASSVSVYGNIQVAPVYSDGSRLVQFDWLSKKEWFDAENTFLIIENEQMKASAIKALGSPEKIINAGGREIYIWGKIIWAGR